jgi:pimeloyl-ACP methyl ester carboxylesterase
MWEPQWELFSASYRTIRMDLRGYGRSALSGTHRGFARDVAELLDTLGVEAAALVGCSIGGQIALEVSVASPGMASAMILVGPGLPDHERSEPMRLAEMQEAAALGRGDIDEAVRISLEVWVAGRDRLLETTDSNLRRSVAEMLAHALELQGLAGLQIQDDLLVPNLRQRLHEVEIPTLVVVGEHDVVDMQVIADQIDTALPRSRRVMVDDAAHLVNMERPAEFNALALEFLGEVLS